MSLLDSYHKFYAIFRIAQSIANDPHVLSEDLDGDYVLRIELSSGERTTSQFQSLEDIQRFLEQYEQAFPDRISDWSVFIGDKEVVTKSGGWDNVHPDVYEHESAKERLEKMSQAKLRGEFMPKSRSRRPTMPTQKRTPAKSAKGRFDELFN